MPQILQPQKDPSPERRRSSFRQLFDNNRFDIVLSIVVAVVAWLIVSLYVMPETTSTVRGIPVRLDYNASAYQSMGLDVVSDGTAVTVSVRVTGPRSIVGGLTKNDITVYPKLTNVTEAGQYELDLVAVKNDTTADYTIEAGSISPSKVTVRFDTLITKKFVVGTDTSNISPADGYILSKAYATPSEVSLTGPEQEIQSIGKVVASVSVSDQLTKTQITTASLSLYDKDGNPYSSNLITFDTRSVEVTIPILKKKTIPLTVEYTDLPDGFDTSLLKATFSATQIDLAGPGDVIDTRTELSVGYIDVAKEFTLGFTKTFQIVLDTGYENLDNLTKVTVSFDTSALSEKTVTVDDIRVVNTPLNRKVTVDTGQIYSVSLIGKSSDVAALTSKNVIAEIDATDLTISEGEQTVPVTIRIPGSSTVFAAGSYTALVVVAAAVSSSSSSGSSSASG